MIPRFPGGVDGRSAVAPCCPPYGSQREWLPTVAIASGVAVVGAVCSAPGSWRRSGSASGLDAQLGRFAFDLGNLAVSALDLGRVTARTGPSTERLQATETASDRRGHIRLFPNLDAVALSLITAGQRGADVSDTSHRAYRQLAPERH